MINRRNFLKTTATALPLAAALDALQPALASAADIHVVAANEPPPHASSRALRAARSRHPILAAEDPSRRPEQHDRARSRRHEHRAMGRLLALRRCAHRLHQRDRNSRLLSLEGPIPSPREISQWPRFLRRMCHRREEARHARRRPHESGPELGRCARRASRVGHAPPGWVRAVQWRRATPVQDLHVHQLHGRLRPRHHARDQLALRCRLLLHQRMASARELARLPLRYLQQASRLQTLQPTGASSTTVSSSCGRNTTPSPKRRSPTASSSPTSAATCVVDPTSIASAKSRLVPGRQSGPHLRRRSHLGMQPAGTCLQCRARWKVCCQRHRCLLHRRRPLAQRFQESRRNSHVAERNRRQRHVPLLPLHRLRSRIRRRSSLAEGRLGLFPLGRQPRCAPNPAPLARQHRRGHGTEHAASLSRSLQRRSPRTTCTRPLRVSTRPC